MDETELQSNAPGNFFLGEESQQKHIPRDFHKRMSYALSVGYSYYKGMMNPSRVYDKRGGSTGMIPFRYGLVSKPHLGIDAQQWCSHGKAMSSVTSDSSALVPMPQAYPVSQAKKKTCTNLKLLLTLTLETSFTRRLTIFNWGHK